MKKLLFTLLLAVGTLTAWADAKYPDALYVVGNAISTGWDINNAQVLTKTSANYYEGFVEFTNAGEGTHYFKFLCQQEANAWFPMWGRDEDATDPVIVSDRNTTDIKLSYYTGADNTFQSTISGLYLVSVDLSTEKVSFQEWTGGSVYLIGNLEQLKFFANRVNNVDPLINGKLTADIGDNDHKMGYAIGWFNSDSDQRAYSGEFDGNNKTVYLGINDGGYNNKGLFGAITDDAYIHDVTVTGSVVGQDNVAGIVAILTGSAKISGCMNYASITGHDNVAGIVGLVRGTGSAEISGCMNYASITARKYAAGIMGYLCGDGVEADVSNCGNEATITCTDSGDYADPTSAGIAGSTIGQVDILNCYNTGSVTGPKWTAGICAWIDNESSTITNCYSTGTISGDQSAPMWRLHSGIEPELNNNYTTQEGGQGEKIDEDQVTSGELCFKLWGNNPTNPFTQDLSQEGHPTFGSKEVHPAKWFNDDDWDTFYNEEGSSRTAYILNLNETKTKFDLDPNFTLTAKNVKITRTLHELTSDGTASRWNTFCSPVALPKNKFSAVKELKGVTVNGDHYTMNFDDIDGDNLVAGKPYMVQVSSGVNTIDASGDLTVVPSSSSSESYYGLTFTGTFTSGDVPQSSQYSSYFIIKDNVFYNVNSSVTHKAFSGYISVLDPEPSPGGVKVLSLVFEDDPDGIVEMKNEKLKMNDDEAIYNLAGQRISKMQKGINIVNGKKVLF